MDTKATLSRAAWALAALLALAACGSPTANKGATGSAEANVTFRADPPAAVSIDGVEMGRTPIVLAVSAGAHQVRFEAAGFEPVSGRVEVVAGKDVTVQAALAVAAGDDEEAALRTLTAALGIESEGYGEIQVHRGAGDGAVMLYWPRKTVRKEGVGTYRIEVTDTYSGEGFLEFRDGREVLFREPFQPDSYVTERAVPAKVHEALRRGRTIEWGIWYEGREKPVTTEFRVADGAQLEARWKKIQRRQVFRRASAIEQRLARIELLGNYRFYSEALEESMGVLNTWPETQLPFKAIAASLQRLELKDSSLYQEVASRLRGGKGARAGGGGLGGVARPLPQTLVAPRLRPEDAQAGGGGKPNHFGVTPTPDAQKRGPGAIEGGEDGASASPGGVPVGRREPAEELARKARLDELKAELARLEEQARLLEGFEQAAATAEEDLAAAGEALAQASAAAAAAEKALDAAEQSGDEAAIAAAQQALKSAQESQAEAQAAQEGAQEAKREADRLLTEARERDAEGRARMKELEDQIAGDGAANPSGAPTPVAPQPGAAPLGREDARRALEAAQGGLSDARLLAQDATKHLAAAEASLSDAQSALQSAQADRAAIDAAQQALADAEAAGDDAAADAARKQLDDANVAHEKAVEEARQAVARAENERTRAEIDRERAEAAERQAQAQVDEAQAAVDAAGR